MRASALASSMQHGYANAQAFSQANGSHTKVARPNMRGTMVPPLQIAALKPASPITVKVGDFICII